MAHFATGWLLCLFSGVLPLETCMRLWDYLLYEQAPCPAVAVPCGLACDPLWGGEGGETGPGLSRGLSTRACT